MVHSLQLLVSPPVKSFGTVQVGYLVRLSSSVGVVLCRCLLRDSCNVSGLAKNTAWFAAVQVLVDNSTGDVNSDFSNVVGPFQTLAQPAQPAPPVLLKVSESPPVMKVERLQGPYSRTNASIAIAFVSPSADSASITGFRGWWMID